EEGPDALLRRHLARNGRHAGRDGGASREAAPGRLSNPGQSRHPRRRSDRHALRRRSHCAGSCGEGAGRPGPSGAHPPDPHPQPPMPKLAAPILFNTPEADAICSALEVFPPDNPWNLVVEDWPLHPRSKNIIASIGSAKPFRVNADMGFVLIPPDQKKAPVKLV